MGVSKGQVLTRTSLYYWFYINSTCMCRRTHFECLFLSPPLFLFFLPSLPPFMEMIGPQLCHVASADKASVAENLHEGSGSLTN